ncbi:MAG: hypothetical protein LBT90_01855 [Holosporaceae bacterium]|jgi:hypothetical protein|nr:hypothetical protein [Holosporaceae bacterium]
MNGLNGEAMMVLDSKVSFAICMYLFIMCCALNGMDTAKGYGYLGLKYKPSATVSAIELCKKMYPLWMDAELVEKIDIEKNYAMREKVELKIAAVKSRYEKSEFCNTILYFVFFLKDGDVLAKVIEETH